MQVNSDTVPASMQDPTQAQARQWIHFPLSLPSHLPAGVGQTIHFTLLGSAAGTFTFNVAKVQAYLAQSRQSGIRIPAQLARATFTITSDTGVVIHYARNCRLLRVTSFFCTGRTPFHT